MYTEGSTAPEWDDYMKQAFYSEGSDDWVEYLNAGYALLEWRAEWGMYEFLPPPQEPVDVDREQFKGCTEESRKLAENLALYY